MSSAKRPGPKNKKKDMRGAIVFFTVVAVLLLTLVILALKMIDGPAGTDQGRSASAGATAPVPSITATPVPTPTPEPAFSPRTATIRAVGDLMMHEEQLEAAARPGKGYDFYPQYAMIAESLSAADYTIANLETTVGLYSDNPYSGYPLFNAPPELVEAVRDAGVDFVSLANNHILDRYYDGMMITIDSVEAAGLAYGGVNRSQAQKDAPNIVEVNGIRLGMLCYTQSTNGMEDHSDPRATEFGVNYTAGADYAAEVQKLRDAGADVVIAIMHWGREYRRDANSAEERISQSLINAGVDVILGSHPHVVQPAGMRETTLADGTPHETFLVYSMGNFNSGMVDEYANAGIIVEFTLVEREEGGFDVENIGFLPTYCWPKNGCFTTINAVEYYDVRPDGMTSEEHARLRKSVDDVQALMGGRLSMLEK